LLRPRLHLRRKAANGVNEIPAATNQEGQPDRFHAALLRCLWSPATTRGESIHRHGSVQGAQEQALPRRRQSDIAQNQAFILADPETRKAYAKAFAESTALYYGDKPTFEQILAEIGKWIDRL
jgi:hypothetical protein